MKHLTSEGIGCQKRQTEPISPAQECELWEKGIFGDKTGQTLLNTVFYYNGNLVGLRALDEHEHRSLSSCSSVLEKTALELALSFWVGLRKPIREA